MDMDYKIFQSINQFAGKSSFLDQFVILFSLYGPILFGLVLVWLWFSKKGNKDENRKIVLLAFTVAVITLGIDKVIELSYFRPRPFVNNTVTMLVEKSNLDPSFPSNHSAGAFALALTILWKRRRVGVILLIAAFSMALSRIYIGVHYPLDVIVGALIALSVSCLVIWQRPLLETPYNWLIKNIEKLHSKVIN